MTEHSKFEADKSRRESEEFVKEAEEAKKMASESKFEAEKAKETLNFVADNPHQDIVLGREEAEDAKILAYRKAEQVKKDNLQKWKNIQRKVKSLVKQFLKVVV